jgi:nucleoside-diphosphate-sugar epimerase
MMASALIGYTGLVGSHLVRQAAFDDCYNSQNIEQIQGRAYDLLVCAGARAEKWLANREPARDRENIERLMQSLAKVQTRQIVLISTVDVYASPNGSDEATPITRTGLNPYGLHRYELEEFVRQQAPTLAVRLPGLFGHGLKKNVIYDFLHGNQVDRIHHASVFQFYDLEWLWSDVERALAARLELVNFATEPVSVADVAREAFGMEFDNAPTTPPARYDMRSRHAPLFGGRDGYLRARAQVLSAMRSFVLQEMALCN